MRSVQGKGWATYDKARVRGEHKPFGELPVVSEMRG